jgi:hypothetical protein
MWLIKGREISFEMDDGQKIALPKRYGMIHNPKQSTKCVVYFGPYERAGESVTQMPRIASLYFGSDYDARGGYIDLPEGKWDRVGNVNVIFYDRPGEHSDYYRHEFKEPVPLSRNGEYWRITLPKGSVVNDRGFVSP